MAPDDREQQFERALAKHLREASEKACPDAELLSAYHEGTLSLEEMAKWTEHIAGCARCQETLALVEQTENVDAEALRELGGVQHVDDLAALPRMRAAAAKMGMEEARSVKAVETQPAVAVAKRRPRAQWKWIAPLGAVAAGVIVWVGAVEVQKHRDLEAQKTVQVAQNRESAAKPSEPAAGASSRDEDKTLRAATPAAEAPQSSDAAKMIAPGAVAGRIQESDQKKDTTASTGFGSGNGVGARAPAAPARSGADAFGQPRSDVSALTKESGVSGNAAANAPVSRASPAPLPLPPKGRAAVASGSSAGAAKTASVSTITGTVLDSSGAAISGAVVTAIDTASGNSKTAVADGAGRFALVDLPSDQYKVVVAHSGFAKSEQTLTLAPEQNEELQIQLKVGAATETVEVTGAAADSLKTNSVSGTPLETLPVNGRAFGQLAQLAASNPRYILSPDQKQAWRVGDGGKIERSSDHGKSWKLQSSGISRDLRAGSATSAKVCWVIGTAGTLLLTTDGGKHWKQVTSPIEEDIGGIRATDARQATIWDVPNRKSFQTSDGGLTWTPAANE